VKVARTVLRGRGRSNASPLPDFIENLRRSELAALTVEPLTGSSSCPGIGRIAVAHALQDEIPERSYSIRRFTAPHCGLTIRGRRTLPGFRPTLKRGPCVNSLSGSSQQ